MTRSTATPIRSVTQVANRSIVRGRRPLGKRLARAGTLPPPARSVRERANRSRGAPGPSAGSPDDIDVSEPGILLLPLLLLSLKYLLLFRLVAARPLEPGSGSVGLLVACLALIATSALAAFIVVELPPEC